MAFGAKSKSKGLFGKKKKDKDEDEDAERSDDESESENTTSEKSFADFRLTSRFSDLPENLQEKLQKIEGTYRQNRLNIENLRRSEFPELETAETELDDLTSLLEGSLMSVDIFGDRMACIVGETRDLSEYGGECEQLIRGTREESARLPGPLFSDIADQVEANVRELSHSIQALWSRLSMTEEEPCNRVDAIRVVLAQHHDTLISLAARVNTLLTEVKPHFDELVRTRHGVGLVDDALMTDFLVGPRPKEKKSEEKSKRSFGLGKSKSKSKIGGGMFSKKKD